MAKNMIIRLGVDASDFKKKMEQAGVTAESTGKKLKKNLSMDVAEIMGWGGSSSGITGNINIGNFEAAKSQLGILKSYRDQLAAAGFDDLQFGEVSERIKVLEYELNAYNESLKQTSDAEREASAEIENLGQTAARTRKPLGETVRSFWEMATSGRKLSIIPGFFHKIRDSADNSNVKLEKMVRTIRNVSVVSFGLRLAKGLFGELGTIVRQYVSENAALQAQVNGLKTAFGQALAPAINVVTNALAVLMPYVVGVSNAIGSLISNLFGSGWTTVAADANAAAKAIGRAGGAQKEFNRALHGFDEITKLDSKSSGGGGASTTTTPVEAKTPAWMTSLAQQIESAAANGDFYGVGAALANALNTGIGNLSQSDSSLGSKIAGWINNGISGATGFVETMDWYGLGESISTNFSELVQGIDWVGAFKFAGSIINGVGEAIAGLLEDGVTKAGEKFQKSIDEATGMGMTANAGAGFAVGSDFARLLGYELPEPVSVDVEANLTTWKDNLRNKRVDFQTRLSTWKDNLSNKVVDFQSKLTSWKDNLKNKSIDFQSRFTSWKESLQNKSIDFQSRFTSWKESLQNKSIDFQSRFTSWKENLQNKSIDFQSRFTSWKENLQNKSIDFQSRFTSWKESLQNKSIDFQSRLTTWKDSLSNKVLSFSAAVDVIKGWTGSLASKLGIDSIKSKLEMKLPKISIDWGQVTALGKTFKYPKGFDIKWNARGAILNSAQIFGQVGNTLLGGGEAGREALLPLDRNTGWMDQIADRVSVRVAGGAQVGDQNITVNLVVDGKVLASTVVRNVNAQARATGKNPLAVYI